MFDNKWQRRNGHRKVGTTILAALVTGSLFFTMTAYGGGDLSPAGRIKAGFDAAMGKPLEQRISLLEGVEQEIDQKVFDGTFTGKGRVEPLWVLFQVQQKLAKYPASRGTFGQYVSAVKSAFGDVQATTIIEGVIDRQYRRGDKIERVALIDQALEVYADHLEITPYLLLRKAQGIVQLIGRTSEAIAPLEKAIAEYPDSRWRPWAMRTLANVQVASSQDDAALSTLTLMEQLYKGTWFEQYAHMHAGTILENRKGDPQGALERYQETLRRFPDHHFSGYVRTEIERLQKIIEEQLIRDALDDLGRNTQQHQENHSGASQIGFRIIHSQDRMLSATKQSPRPRIHERLVHN